MHFTSILFSILFPFFICVFVLGKHVHCMAKGNLSESHFVCTVH
uniref:Uncharacterized protein n=1 Tax=Anguilla anguilla TaxID=7936 RepID=A0A0E9W3D0_ANGAN